MKAIKSDGSYEEFDREKLINLVKKVFKTANIKCNVDCAEEIVDSLCIYDGIMCSSIWKQLIERFSERDENLLNAYMVVMENLKINLDKDMKTYEVGTFVKITSGFHEGCIGRIIGVKNTLFRPTYYIVEFCNHTSCEFTEDSLTEIPQEQHTRAVEISLEKARDWYNQGGPLREIALQAFSKAELELPSYTYGQLMTVNGMCGYIIGMDESGYPNAWVSDILGIPSSYVFSDCITREDALKLELKGGWHIPSYCEIEELKCGFKKANISYIIWTTGPDPMCWWGDEPCGRPHLRPCRAILKK